MSNPKTCNDPKVIARLLRNIGTGDNPHWKMFNAAADLLDPPARITDDAQCSAASEPVAWEAVDADLNPNATITRDKGVAAIWRKAGLTVRGLYADEPQTVRMLDWQETFTDRGDGSKDLTGWEAETCFGTWYSVEQYFGSDSYAWHVKHDFDVVADCDDPDQAKEAAQADFEKRVALALSRPKQP